MAVLTASQLQSRGSLLVRGLGVLLLLFGAARFLLPHLRSPVECSAPKRVAHASVAPAERTTSAKEGDERVLECDAGFVIDGFQPLSSALMLCRDGGGGSGEWQCSDSGMGDSWPCAARGCVEVSHCDPLPDDVDTGHGQMVMDASKCGQVEIGKSCTVSCGEGFAGESIFTCQRDGTWRGDPPSCRFVDHARARLYEKPE